MGENENDAVITAVFEDNTRKRYNVNKSILAKDFIDIVLLDTGNDQYQNNSLCLIEEGHIYENDEPLFSKTNSQTNEISLNIVFNPILTSEKNSSFTIDDFEFVLDQDYLQELETMFPIFINAERRTRNRNVPTLARYLKKAIFGFFSALIMGPFSVLMLPCSTLDISTLIGLVLGIAAWLFMFMSMTTKNPNRNITKKMTIH